MSCVIYVATDCHLPDLAHFGTMALLLRDKQVSELSAQHKLAVVAIGSVLGALGAKPDEALRILREVGEKVVIDPEDGEAAFERVRLNSIGAAEELLGAEGGGISADEFAAAAGVSRETVRRYREAGLIIAWKKDARNYRYSAWQIHNGGILRGLGSVLEVLARRWTRLSPVTQLDYFLSQSEELGGRRPLDVLRDGEEARVLDYARRYGEAGA